MEDLREIVVIKKLYFKGKASLKFRSDYHAPDSKNSIFDLYKIDEFYDIVINDIKQIAEYTYLKHKKSIVFDFLSKSKSIIVKHDHTAFEIDAKSFFCTNQITPYHIQTEGDIVHGYFKDIDIIFEIEKEETLFVPTDKIIVEPTLSTDHIQDNSEIVKAPILSDEELDEKKYIPPKPPVPIVENNFKDGCYTVLGYIFLAIIALFYIFIFIYSGQIFILLAWLIFIGIVSGISYLFDFLSNFGNTRIGNSIFGIFRWLLSLAFVFLLLFGFSKLFDSNNWHKSRDEQIIKTEENEFIEDNKPSPVTPEPYVKDSLNQDTTNYIQDSIITINRKWRGLDNKIYQGKYKLYLSKIRNSERKIQNLPNYNSFSYVYNDLYENDKKDLVGLYKMLDSIKIANNQNRLDFANTIVSMIQSIKYVLILENVCNADVYSDIETKNMINSADNCLGFSPFGLRTPLQFMSDLNGDCDTRTLVLYTIFRHYNYDVAIINSDVYKHSMIGLNIKNVNGAYKIYNGKKYYFWETTNEGFNIGNLPREYGNVNYWNLTLN